MNNQELLTAIFGESLPELSNGEREAAERVLEWLRKPNDTRTKLQKIAGAADESLKEIYGLGIEDLGNKGRKMPYADYRRWAMIEMSGKNLLTQREVAEIFCRERSSISNAKSAVENLCSVDKKYREEHKLFVQTFNKKLLCENIMSFCR